MYFSSLILLWITACARSMRRPHWRRFNLRPSGLLITSVLLTAVGAAHGQTFTWVGPGAGWNTASNWSPAGVPNSSTASVNFTGAALGQVDITASVAVQTITFSNPTGNYSVASTVGVFLSNVTTLNVGNSVSGVETINLANIASGSLLFGASGNNTNLTITNNSSSSGTSLV